MIKIEHNAETGEVKEITLTVKESTDLEKLYSKNADEQEIITEELAKRAAAKAEVLARLGLTAEEAKLLLG
jgi:hypothetical protein